MDGAAFDIAMANHDPVAFEAAARRLGEAASGLRERRATHLLLALAEVSDGQ